MAAGGGGSFCCRKSSETKIDQCCTPPERRRRLRRAPPFFFLSPYLCVILIPYLASPAGKQSGTLPTFFLAEIVDGGNASTLGVCLNFPSRQAAHQKQEEEWNTRKLRPI